ncbi:MAG: hypothetical protein COU32_01405 [Candidatus Magasanikbacteria bacterium CG10_big_fil_rev_8_21_14_0_10_42_10]|uniref:Pyrrolidone-carboxylate peptidase n=2 Tax=Candidatus Magasanikiibacteriota TaxID=1752731 RepID=A0A2H0TWL7_9BACT|nr:MAG: hypothetical protein COU32_01405 [Candidatus Magasanikbacteria bacterium CG10_big_fil_rev_8_21_14_0_10_42_10]PIZ92687.1 MAG: hypothetical protein COX82_04325 [Candidatus Magasanikbacteria bacterium CG_4_10_14_0_2_um_filter_41_10]
MKTLLLTAFEPFGPYTKNVSKKLVQKLQGTMLKNDTSNEINIVGVVLPIEFHRFRKVLQHEVEKYSPHIVVGLGMDFKDQSSLSFELLAHRTPSYGTTISDNKGIFGQNKKLDTLAEELRLPNEHQLTNIITKIDGIELSEHAGGFMCETVFRDLIRLSENGTKFQPIFIHVPHTKNLLQESKKLEEHTHYESIEKQEMILKEVLTRLIQVSTT